MSATDHPVSVLFLTKYARNGASSRYRSYQYLPILEENGIKCHVSPLFSENYLRRRYQSRFKALPQVFAALFRRLAVLTTVFKYDVVFIEKEILPYFPALPERLLNALRIPYIVDYDDALFHQYDSHKRIAIRRLFSGKIKRVMRGARLVIAGNEYLADYARSAGSKWIEVLPTVVNLDKYPSRQRSATDTIKFTIGWIGSPSTTKYLGDIGQPLAVLCREGATQVNLIGASEIAVPDVPVKLINWSEATEVDEISEFDVGIMPLTDSPWERGKCGFKLIQYMACGIPIVASPVGVNADIVEDGINGFLAQTAGQWEKSLLRLRDNADLRAKLGAAGRKKVEREFCLAITAPQMVNLVRKAATKKT